jgi:hypothetical protein
VGIVKQPYKMLVKLERISTSFKTCRSTGGIKQPIFLKTTVVMNPNHSNYFYESRGWTVDR